MEQHARLKNPERQQAIGETIAKDRQAFTDWLTDNQQQPNLAVSPQAARYLIPERLYELVDDPHALQVRMIHASKGLLGMFVVEALPEPITNRESLTQYGQQMSDSIKAGGKLPIPDLPPDVDPKHALYRNILDQADVTMHDKIILNIYMTQFGNDELFIDSYDDRPGYRNKGVATSFYKRLREVARSMNEYYIVGNNREGSGGELGSIDFFVNKQGRVRFSELTGKYRDAIWERHAPYSFKPESADYWTIDFLDPLERSLATSVEQEK